MKKSHIFLILLIIMFFVLPPRRGGIFSSYNVTERDTTIYNVTYRDSVVYNVIKKDSVITDYRLVSVTEFDTTIIHDTTYIAIPIASYHFSDKMSDIWASGYRVTLDSVRYHLPEKETIFFVAPRKRWLTADVGGSLGRTLNDVYFSANVRGAVTIKSWSIEAKVGLMTTGDDLTPFVGVGVRKKLR